MATRFKAKVLVGDTVAGSDDFNYVGKTLHPTRDRAIKDGVDWALRAGLIVVEEVEVEQKVRREWVEKEAPK